MSLTWKFMTRKRHDDVDFLHHDYQPATPSSKINLQERFGVSNGNASIRREHQYVNFKQNTGIHQQQHQKLYENQQELLENVSQLQHCNSLPEQPPPLPPRNNTPVRHTNYNTNTTINIDASTNIANAISSNAPDDCIMETNDDDEVVTDNPKQSFHMANKLQSKSSSALQRFAVKPFLNAQKFNQTFAGDENIYNNLCEDEEPADGIGSLLESLQDTSNDGKNLGGKFLKMSTHKLTQAVQGCRTAIASISQKFRSSTQRRYKLDSNSPRASGYSTPPHGSIRRTPGKLYSPFNCSTPPAPRGYEAKRLQHRISRVHVGQENRGPRTPSHRAVGKSPARHTVSFSAAHSTSVHARLRGTANAGQRINNILFQATHHHEQQPHHQYLNSILSCKDEQHEQQDRFIEQFPSTLPSHLTRSEWSSFHTPRRVSRPIQQQSQQKELQGPSLLDATPLPMHRRTATLTPVSAASIEQRLGVLSSAERRSLSLFDGNNLNNGSMVGEIWPSESGSGAGGTGVVPGTRVVDSETYKRHMVEFDQMSRNITVSLARNSKFRNSVR